jgi:pyrroline-5-carboxylate reductase
MSEPIRIAMVGGGVMGGALVDGFLGAVVDGRPTQVSVVEADPVRADAWRQREGIEVARLEQAVAEAAVVVLAVKPHQIIEVLGEMASSLASDAIVVSIAAGITLDAMQAAVPTGTSIIRTMPNTPTKVGKGVIGLVAGGNCSREQVDLVSSLLQPMALVVEVPEEQIDALTATSGSGPAYVFYLAEAMRRGAEELGLPSSIAATLVAKTFVGAAELLTGDPADAEGLRASVTSKGGTTAAAIAVFEEEDMRGIVARAMNANVQRSIEMADESG